MALYRLARVIPLIIIVGLLFFFFFQLASAGFSYSRECESVYGFFCLYERTHARRHACRHLCLQHVPASRGNVNACIHMYALRDGRKERNEFRCARRGRRLLSLLTMTSGGLSSVLYFLGVSHGSQNTFPPVAFGTYEMFFDPGFNVP